jgi:hypothetical protein
VSCWLRSPIRNHLPVLYAASRLQHLDQFRDGERWILSHRHSTASRCSGVSAASRHSLASYLRRLSKEIRPIAADEPPTDATHVSHLPPHWMKGSRL